MAFTSFVALRNHSVQYHSGALLRMGHGTALQGNRGYGWARADLGRHESGHGKSAL